MPLLLRFVSLPLTGSCDLLVVQVEKVLSMGLIRVSGLMGSDLADLLEVKVSLRLSDNSVREMVLRLDPKRRVKRKALDMHLNSPKTTLLWYSKAWEWMQDRCSDESAWTVCNADDLGNDLFSYLLLTFNLQE
jgi:hypothetical protein